MVGSLVAKEHSLAQQLEAMTALATQEKAKAEQEKAKAERLAQRLRALGVDPDRE
jgi:hypothetical protein